MSVQGPVDLLQLHSRGGHFIEKGLVCSRAPVMGSKFIVYLTIEFSDTSVPSGMCEIVEKLPEDLSSSKQPAYWYI